MLAALDVFPLNASRERERMVLAALAVSLSCGADVLAWGALAVLVALGKAGYWASYIA